VSSRLETLSGAQLDRPVGLRGGAVGEVGVILILVLEMLQRLLGLFQEFLLPLGQLLAEVFPLALVHERLVLGRTVVLVGQTGVPVLAGGALLLILRTHGFPIKR